MELREDYEEFAALDAEVLAISVDDLAGADYVVADLGIQFPVLYDPQAEVIRPYGVYNLLRDNLATPAVFVIDKAGQVRWRWVAERYNQRPANQQIIDELEKIG